jgi:uncharacterized protein YcnI
MRNFFRSNGQLLFIFVASFIPLPGWAHVTVDPKAAPAGSYAKLTFRVPHGCDGSPTVKLTVQIPEGVSSVKPQVHPGWKIKIQKKKPAKTAATHEAEEAVSEVSWSDGELPDEYMDEFGLSVKLPAEEGQRLLFPVIQECKKGSMHWVSAQASGHGDHAERLAAPSLTLTAPNHESMHHHH